MEKKLTTGKSLTVKEAAEIMGKSQQFIRIGLQRGLLPFGNAIKMSSVWTYYISPKQFYEYVGINDELFFTNKSVQAMKGGENNEI